MPDDVQLLLVRHGESTWNAEGRWQGQADPPLSPRGRDQARAAAGALPPVDLVASSDLERARATAEALTGPGRGGPVRVDPGLRERDAGPFSGLTRAEIHRRFPGLLPDDPARPAGTAEDGLIAPPGWEPDAALAERAWAALDRVAAALVAGAGTTAVVVTHSGLIYALERPYGGPRLRIANLEGRWFARRSGRWERGDRQLLLDPAADEVTRPDQI